MNIHTTEYAQGTSITRTYPWGFNIKARALCPDGKVRTCKRLAETADTFFSTPASMTIKGRTVAGYVTLESIAGYSTCTADDPAIVKFVPYTYRKNGAVFDSVRP